MTNIMQSLRDFIKACPYIDEFNEGIGMDYLDAEDGSYSIESAPGTPVLKRYVDGSAKKQQVFTFSSRESYGADVRQNLENIGFYEHFADWLDEMSAREIFPKLGDNITPLKIEATTNGYAFQTDEKYAKYQIQCRLVYLQEGVS